MARKTADEKEILKVFLKDLPVAHALARSCEAIAFAGKKLEPPILDIGCGDGVFAAACFGKKGIDTGLDFNSAEIKLARRRGAYKKVVVGEAGRMPFAGDSFSTVISNSVFEHLPDHDRVFSEINRVLKRGGKLMFTVPNERTKQHYVLGNSLRAMGFSKAGSAYINWKNRLWQQELYPKKYWIKLLEQNNFRVREASEFVDPKVVVTMDLLMPVSALQYFLKKLFKRWVILRPEWVNAWLADLLVLKVDSRVGRNGVSCYFEAEKYRSGWGKHHGEYGKQAA